MFHISERSGNYSLGSAAQLCVTQTNHGQPLTLRHFFNGEVPSNNTTQNQPKTHANLLISGKFCSLPVLLRYEILTRHKKTQFFQSPYFPFSVKCYLSLINAFSHSSTRPAKISPELTVLLYSISIRLANHIVSQARVRAIERQLN